MQSSNSKETYIAQIKAKIGSKEFVIMMAALMALNALAIDVMLPALDRICIDLHASHLNDQHYIIFTYLLGFGFSHIIYGPLSDRYGRKIPLLVGLIIYCLAAFLCTKVQSFNLLLLLRILQGAGAATTRILTLAMVRDLYHGNEMASTTSMIFMVFILVPVIAPATGQLLLLFGDWEIIFLFMSLLSLVIGIWVYLRLPETLYKKRALDYKTLKNSFSLIFSNHLSLYYTLAVSCLFGGLFSAINTSKQIYVDVFHLGKLFPIAFASVAITQACAAFANARLVNKIGIRRISHTVLLAFIGSSLVWSAWTFMHNGMIPFPVYMLLFMIIMFSYGCLGANFNALIMEPLGEVAGTASAVLGFAQTTIASLLGLLVAQQFQGNTQPLAFGFFLLGIATLIFVLLAENGKLFNEKANSTVSKLVVDKN